MRGLGRGPVIRHPRDVQKGLREFMHAEETLGRVVGEGAAQDFVDRRRETQHHFRDPRRLAPPSRLGVREVGAFFRDVGATGQHFVGDGG